MMVALSVTTLRDNFVENNEYFKATLNLPDAQEVVVVGSPDVVFVTIVDDTRMFNFYRIFTHT